MRHARALVLSSLVILATGAIEAATFGFGGTGSGVGFGYGSAFMRDAALANNKDSVAEHRMGGQRSTTFLVDRKAGVVTGLMTQMAPPALIRVAM